MTRSCCVFHVCPCMCCVHDCVRARACVSVPAAVRALRVLSILHLAHAHAHVSCEVCGRRHTDLSP